MTGSKLLFRTLRWTSPLVFCPLLTLLLNPLSHHPAYYPFPPVRSRNPLLHPIPTLLLLPQTLTPLPHQPPAFLFLPTLALRLPLTLPAVVVMCTFLTALSLICFRPHPCLRRRLPPPSVLPGGTVGACRDDSAFAMPRLTSVLIGLLPRYRPTRFFLREFTHGQSICLMRPTPLPVMTDLLSVKCN